MMSGSDLSAAVVLLLSALAALVSALAYRLRKRRIVQTKRKSGGHGRGKVS